MKGKLSVRVLGDGNPDSSFLFTGYVTLDNLANFFVCQFTTLNVVIKLTRNSKTNLLSYTICSYTLSDSMSSIRVICPGEAQFLCGLNLESTAAALISSFAKWQKEAHKFTLF